MHDLLAKEAVDPHAAVVDLFWYQARKFLGALAAARRRGIATLRVACGICGAVGPAGD